MKVYGEKGMSMSMRREAWAGALIGLAGAWAGAHGAEVTIGASRDTSMYSENLSFSNGAGEYIFTGYTASGTERRAMIAFDVAGTIPAGSTINSVTLHLHMITTGPNTGPVALHRVLAGWGEWLSDAGDPGGQGVLAETGDASWAYRVYPGTPWTTAGGDYSAAASASTDITTVGAYSWTSAGMKVDVQAWLDAPAANQGWLLKMPTVNQNAKRFASRENVLVEERPALTIVFSPLCPVDLDNDGDVLGGLLPDGSVDINDLLAFLVIFEEGGIAGDLDNDGDPAEGLPDGSTDINDLLFFLARFENGC